MKLNKIDINPWYYVAFVITRMLDVGSTYINTNKWGIDVEGNPIQLFFMNSGFFLEYQLIIAIWVVGLTLFLHNRVMKIVLFGATIMSLIVAIFNTIIFLITSFI